MGERIAVFCPVASFLEAAENQWTRSPKVLVHGTRPVLIQLLIKLFECKHLKAPLCAP